MLPAVSFSTALDATATTILASALVIGTTYLVEVLTLVVAAAAVCMHSYAYDYDQQVPSP